MANFSTKTEGKWFYFVPGDESKGGVCLRTLPIKEAKNIRKQCTSKKKDVVHGQLVRSDEVDEETNSRLVWQYCIVDWKNVQIDGVEVECNAMGKEKAMLCKQKSFYLIFRR